MIKKLCSLRNKKGFTLVECVVAIAVFALMATVVMQMLALSIQTYTHNDRTDKDLDIQLENLIKKNNLKERESFDFTVDFLNPDDTSAGTMSVTGISVNRIDENVDGRLELNTLGYSLADVGTSSEPTSSSNPDPNNLAVVKNYMHLYGSRGFESIYAEEVSDVVSGDIHTITLKFKVNDPNGVLEAGYINSIKVSLPSSADHFVVSNTTGNISSIFLGNTVRMYLPANNSTGATSYDFTISFRLPDNRYSEYGSFVKYFIDLNSAATDKSDTFVENVNALGVYNIKQGTVQVED